MGYAREVSCGSRCESVGVCVVPIGAVRTGHSLGIRECATQPVILWILLGGTTKWLPLNFGFNDVMHMAPNFSFVNTLPVFVRM